MGTHDASKLRIGNRLSLVTDDVTYTFYYVWSFDPFFWISKKYMAKQKFRAVSIVLLSHRIGAQFQHHPLFPIE